MSGVATLILTCQFYCIFSLDVVVVLIKSLLSCFVNCQISLVFYEDTKVQPIILQYEVIGRRMIHVNVNIELGNIPSVFIDAYLTSHQVHIVTEAEPR